MEIFGNPTRLTAGELLVSPPGATPVNVNLELRDLHFSAAVVRHGATVNLTEGALLRLEDCQFSGRANAPFDNAPNLSISLGSLQLIRVQIIGANPGAVLVTSTQGSGVLIEDSTIADPVLSTSAAGVGVNDSRRPVVIRNSLIRGFGGAGVCVSGATTGDLSQRSMACP